MRHVVRKFSFKRLKRYRSYALVIVAISVLVCELPLLLAMIGLSELMVSIPPHLGVYTVAALALLMVAGLLIYRMRFRNKAKQ